MTFVPESHRDLLRDEIRAPAYLATLMADGSPQLTPLWFNTDGKHILVNTAKGRVKDRNMRARPVVALVIQDPRIDTRYIQVRGRVVDISEHGALDHIDRLSMKYRERHWDAVEGQTRVTHKILPYSVFVDD